MKPAQRLHAIVLSVIATCGPELALAQSECKPTPTYEGRVSNDELRVLVGNHGHVVFRPGGPGFVTSDGALGLKFLWERLVEGKLQVSGRRIDGDAPPMRTEISDAYGDRGIQPSYLIFPEAGCWEITARVRDKPLSVIVRVEKQGAGPSWRRN